MTELPQIYVDGDAMVQRGGAHRWVFAGTQEYTLWQQFIKGVDIGPICQQRKEAGANTVCVASMLDGGLGKFHPWEVGEWWTSLRAFIPFVESFGLYVKLDVFLDAQRAMPWSGLRQQWWHDISKTCADYPSVFCVSAGNEWPQNGWRPEEFARPSDTGHLLFSRGSSLSDCPPWGNYGDPYVEQWDVMEFHGRRDVPKNLMAGEDMFFLGEGYEPKPNQGVGNPVHPVKPIIHSEPIGFAEVAVPNRRANDEKTAQITALASRTYGCGGAFLCDQSQHGQLWSGKTLACAQAFYRALNAEIGETY